MIRNLTTTDAQYDLACDESGQLAADVQAHDSRAEFSFDCESIEVADRVPTAEWSLRWSFSGDMRYSIIRGLVRALVRVLGCNVLWIREDGYIVEVRTRRIGESA